MSHHHQCKPELEETFVFLVFQGIHRNYGGRAAAKQGNHQQGIFRNPPPPFTGSFLVLPIYQDGYGIYAEEINYSIGYIEVQVHSAKLSEDPHTVPEVYEALFTQSPKPKNQAAFNISKSSSLSVSRFFFKVSANSSETISIFCSAR